MTPPVVVSLVVESIGAALNVAAVIANGGRMPVYGAMVSPLSRSHMQGRSTDRLRWACDRIPLRAFRRRRVVSLGDLLMLAGVMSCLIFVATE